eukprot:CAMPEP_0206041224 /NCGR_PEP_ID=MMETSP1466-20131121/5853_1 /ASSEMBLY_ACC=CAM_ASM_001126 /TAXON_ID=44452 /ORGANISM="Pavlova gyrans, Strain CCMP608" /LENGTH=45 /DNA_ID= /DNA_START= /DNA_END= /DNA_ORIENTATION=
MAHVLRLWLVAGAAWAAVPRWVSRSEGAGGMQFTQQSTFTRHNSS